MIGDPIKAAAAIVANTVKIALYDSVGPLEHGFSTLPGSDDKVRMGGVHICTTKDVCRVVRYLERNNFKGKINRGLGVARK